MKSKVLLVSGCLFACHPCIAQGRDEVLQELQNADAAFRTGAYSASACITIYSSPNPADDEIRLQSRHAIMRGDKFDFTEVDTKPDGKLILRQRAVFDGQDKVRWIGESVDISRGAGDSLSPILGLVTLQPGPGILQGRGLSSMRIQSLARDSTSSFWILKAQAADGSQIKAWLDPKARFLARRIERSDNNKELVAHIRTEGVLSGGLLPLRSLVSVPVIKARRPDIYTFSQAEFPTKREISFKGIFHRPASIMDNRLSSAVGIKKESHTPTSMAQLLAITQDETRRLQKFKEAENAAETRQLWMNRAMMTLPALLAALILLWRPKKRKIAHDV